MGPLLKIVEQIIKSFMEINFKNKFSNSIKKKPDVVYIDYNIYL